MDAFNTFQVIMSMIVSDLIKRICCRKLKLSGLVCRCLIAERMFCGGARSVVHANGFVAIIIRFDTNTNSRGRTLFVLIGCERSGEYRCRKKEFVRRDTGTRKCGCPFKLRGKPVDGGQAWMVKLICGIHNHELAKS